MAKRKATRKPRVAARKKNVQDGDAERLKRNEQIAAGEFKIDDELIVLRLQKLSQQKSALDARMKLLAKEHNEVKAKLGFVSARLNEETQKTASAYGLEKYHMILLDDENAGRVVVHEEIKMILEQQVKADTEPAEASE